MVPRRIELRSYPRQGYVLAIGLQDLQQCYLILLMTTFECAVQAGPYKKDNYSL